MLLAHLGVSAIHLNLGRLCLAPERPRVGTRVLNIQMGAGTHVFEQPCTHVFTCSYSLLEISCKWAHSFTHRQYTHNHAHAHIHILPQYMHIYLHLRSPCMHMVSVSVSTPLLTVFADSGHPSLPNRPPALSRVTNRTIKPISDAACQDKWHHHPAHPTLPP